MPAHVVVAPATAADAVVEVLIVGESIVEQRGVNSLLSGPVQIVVPGNQPGTVVVPTPD